MPFTLSPEANLLLLTAGVLLILLELNRPGLILPGACGLTLVLLSMARWWQLGVRPSAVAAGAFGATLLVLSTRMRKRLLPAAFASTALLYASIQPTAASPAARPHPAVAVLCALVLGPGTSLLTTIAARARQNKGLDLK